MNRRPEWNSDLTDPAQYRLTYAEMLTKKASLVSRNKETARVELQKKQAMLSKGIIPPEMKKVIRPPPKKYTANAHRIARDLKPSFDQPLPVTDRKPLTTTYVKPQKTVATSCLRTTNSEGVLKTTDTLTRLDQAMRDLEEAMSKALQDDMHNESELSFNISPDQSIHDDYIFTEPIPAIEDPVAEEPTVGIDSSPQCALTSPQSSYLPPAFDSPVSSRIPTYSEEAVPQPEEAEYDNYFANLIKQTRADLEEMGLQQTTDPPETTEEPLPFEEELVPRQFTLKPIERTGPPRTAIRSLALTDNLQTVHIHPRKFII